VNSVERLATIEARLRARGGTGLTYGNRFLDDLLLGIPRSNIDCLASATGVGKTEALTGIAQANAKAGKRVTYFALEAREGEIEDRMVFRKAVSLYRKKHPGGARLSFRKFSRWQEPALAPFVAAAVEELREHLANVRVRYQVGADAFSVRDIYPELSRAAKESDLVILDHIHYISAAGEKDRNEAQIRMASDLRRVTDETGTPIVVAAQFRKPDGAKKYRPLLPDEHDLRGASELPQMFNNIVVWGPAPDDESKGLVMTPTAVALRAHGRTLMRVVKSREDSEAKRVTGLLLWDYQARAYHQNYALGRLVAHDARWEATPERPEDTAQAAVLELGVDDPLPAEVAK
jgi:hypothetical protein